MFFYFFKTLRWLAQGGGPSDELRRWFGHGPACWEEFQQRYTGLPTGRGGRVAVLPTLQVAGHPEVYVAGDLAYVEQAGWPLPMTAPVATQQGKAVAANIRRQLQGQAALPFRCRDRGVMATIGRNAAVAHVFGRSFTGFIAWVLWLGVHLFSLIGFRNRLLVMLSWAWDYFFYERVVRLLLPRLDRDKR